MIFITTYRIKPLSKDEAKTLMGVFSDKGVPSTVKAHYVAADASQGVVISEADDLEEAYRNILDYSEWIEYDTKPYLTIEQALPHIADYVSWPDFELRESEAKAQAVMQAIELAAAQPDWP